jgi:hypothetical protein
VGHHLAYPNGGPRRQLVRSFANWLLSEIE